MVLPDRILEDSIEKNVEIRNFSTIEERAGMLEINDDTKKLIRSVINNDQNIIENGKLIREAYNQGIFFTPSIIFENLVKNFSFAKKLYGETMIKLLTGYDPSYIEKNISIPEFKNLIKKMIEEKINRMKRERILTKDDEISEIGTELAMIIMVAEEIDSIIPKGYLGERLHKKYGVYGEKNDYKLYRKGSRYRDIAIKRSVKIAVRRGHKNLEENDLRIFDRVHKGMISIIYAIDSSGSMRGSKLDAAKKAGIALAYKAIKENDKVGLVIFGDKIRDSIAPTDNFTILLKKLAKITASRETNIVSAIREAYNLFDDDNSTKHIVLITDALPTSGEMPEKETLEAVAEARSKGATVSVVGITLDKKGKELGMKIAEIGGGRLYAAKHAEEIDKIVLADYENIQII